MDEAEWANHEHGEFLHLEFGCDGAEGALEDEVHE